MVRLVGDSHDYERMLRHATHSTQATAATLGHVGATLTASITAPLMEAARAAEHLADTFDFAMSRVRGILTASTEEMTGLSEAVIGIGARVGRSPEELAKALYFISAAGLRGKEALETLEAAAKGAAAGLGETKAVAFATTSAVNAYSHMNLSATRALEIITAAVHEGKMEMHDLTNVVGRLLPLAAAMGVEFEDLAGTMAVLTRTGFRAAEAAVSIQSLLSTLRKPSVEARSIMAAGGLTFQQLRDMVREAGGVIKVIRLLDKTFGANDEMISQIIPNIRALRGVMNVLNQDAGKVDKTMHGVRNSTGKLDTVYGYAAQTNIVRYQKVMASIQGSMMDLGRTVGSIVIPVMEAFGQVIQFISMGFNQLNPEMRRLAVFVGAAVAAVGPLLLVLGGFVPVLTYMAAGLSVLLGPIGWVTGAVGALLSTLGPVLLFLVAIPAKLLAFTVGLGFIPALFVGIKVLIVSIIPFLIVFALKLAAVVVVFGGIIAAAVLFGALIAGWIDRLGGVEKAWELVQKKAVEAWQWLRPVRDALGVLMEELYYMATGIWELLKETALAAWDAVFGNVRVNWEDVRVIALDVIYSMVYALKNLEQTWEVIELASRYALTAIGNEIIHAFTRTLPYAVGYGLARMLDGFNAMVSYLITKFMELLIYIKDLFIQFDWSSLYDGLLAASSGAMQVFISHWKAMLEEVRKMAIGGKVGEAKFEMAMPKAQADVARKQVEAAKKEMDQAQAAVKKAQDNLSDFQNGLIDKEFKVPLRIETGTEERLRKELAEAMGRMQQGTLTLINEKLMEQLVRQAGEVQDEFVAEMTKWGTPLTKKSEQIGRDMGETLVDGFKKEIGKLENVLFDSAEALSRYNDYRQSLEDAREASSNAAREYQLARVAKQEQELQQRLGNIDKAIQDIINSAKQVPDALKGAFHPGPVLDNNAGFGQAGQQFFGGRLGAPQPAPGGEVQAPKVEAPKLKAEGRILPPDQPIKGPPPAGSSPEYASQWQAVAQLQQQLAELSKLGREGTRQMPEITRKLDAERQKLDSMKGGGGGLVAPKIEVPLPVMPPAQPPGFFNNLPAAAAPQAQPPQVQPPQAGGPAPNLGQYPIIIRGGYAYVRPEAYARIDPEFVRAGQSDAPEDMEVWQERKQGMEELFKQAFGVEGYMGQKWMGQSRPTDQPAPGGSVEQLAVLRQVRDLLAAINRKKIPGIETADLDAP